MDQSSQSIPVLNPVTLAHLQSQGQSIQPGVIWNPFQIEALTRPEFEIALLGGKWSGKSHCARGFLLKGNPDRPDDNPVNQSYVFHPNYRATILRRNQQDLDDFLRRFHQMAISYGGRYTRGLFEFPSGAVIACGHLADRDAWQKYIGVENVRFVLEEAALIPEFDLFDQIRSCCRSIWPDMVPQILLTSNSGGPGTSWLIDRFYEAKDLDGNIVPPGNTIHEVVPHPQYPDDRSKDIDKTRIFLFGTYRDNPYAANDPGYIGTLATMKDPKMRAAYLDGDWRAFQGTYFHLDPARHCIPAQPSLLRPWWHRWGSIDVGYTHETAVHWGCRNPLTRQSHVYRELVVSETSFVQIGYEIASRSLAELEALPSHSMSFFISPDAIRKVTEQKTISDLIMEGIARKLGPNAVHFPEEEIRKFKELSQAQSSTYLSPHEEEFKWRKLVDKIRLQRRVGITLKMAANDRVPGWQFCREAMRLTPISQSSLPPFDRQVYDNLYLSDPRRAEQYLSLYHLPSEEILPQILFWTPSPDLGPYWGCPRLISAIPQAHHAEGPGQNPEDISKAHVKGVSDVLDGWRYLMMGSQDIAQSEPFEDFRDRQMNEFILQNPSADLNDLIFANRQLESRWKAERGDGAKPFSILHGARGRRAGNPIQLAGQSNRGRHYRNDPPDGL